MTTLVDDRDDLLSRVSLSAVLEQLVGPPRHRAWRCPNPNHGQTGRTPPVSIDEAKGLWNCHGCGGGGTAIDALMVAHGITTAEAFTRLRESTGLGRRPEPSPQPPRAHIEPAPPADADDLLAGFIRARGWRPEVAERFGLHVVTDNWGKARVRFPFHRDGEIIWWQDRAIGGAEPKYLAPAGQPQQPYALNLAAALASAADVGECWIVEGLPDVIALGHLADPGKAPAVIGLPGTSFAGLPRLARALTGLIVVVVADADEAGEKMRTTAAGHLEAAGANPVQVRLPAGINDLDDLRRHHGGDDQAFEDAILTARFGHRRAELLKEEAA